MSSSSSSSSWPAFPARRTSWSSPSQSASVRRTANMLVRSPDSLPQLDPGRAPTTAETSRLPPTRRRRAVTAPAAWLTSRRTPSPGNARRSRRALGALATLALLAALASFTSWRLRESSPLPPLTAERVLAGVVARYAAIPHLSAELHLTTTNFSFNSTAERRGRLSLARGGKLRWDAFDPATGADRDAGRPRRVQRSLVSDGTSLTLVDFALRELVKLHRSDDQLVFATSALFSPTLAADFTAQLASLAGYLDDDRGLVLEQDPDRPRYALALLPRAANPRAQRLVLLVDERMNVRQLILENPYGRTRMVLAAQDSRTAPRPEDFLVDPAAPALAGFRFVDAEL